jgi:hypothetical protein
VERNLDESERWIERAMTAKPQIEELRRQFTDWTSEEGRQQELSADVVKAYELANPPGMSADGMLRYWNKFRSS